MIMSHIWSTYHPWRYTHESVPEAKRHDELQWRSGCFILKSHDYIPNDRLPFGLWWVHKCASLKLGADFAFLNASDYNKNRNTRMTTYPFSSRGNLNNSKFHLSSSFRSLNSGSSTQICKTRQFRCGLPRVHLNDTSASIKMFQLYICSCL